MLTGDSDVEEMLAYLEKRHPLYFVNRKLSKDQIRDLVKRLKFRVGEMAKKKAEANKKIEATAPKVLENKLQGPLNGKNKENQKVTFKSGGSLPQLNEETPSYEQNKANEANKKKPAVKFNDQFDEEFGDEFSDGEELDSPEESGNFNADQLLNLTDYQNKRKGMAGAQQK